MNKTEELIQVIKGYTKTACEDPKDYENICDFCDEILENSKAEKERIVKELEEPRRKKGFEMIRIDDAIEIVKRGK